MEQVAFHCSRCGACCLGLDQYPDEEMRALAGPDGSCKHLGPDRKTCTIYDTRPDFCRVDKMGIAIHMPKLFPYVMHEACKMAHRMAYGSALEKEGTCQH